jgi:hypothetical protein
MRHITITLGGIRIRYRSLDYLSIFTFLIQYLRNFILECWNVLWSSDGIQSTELGTATRSSTVPRASYVLL